MNKILVAVALIASSACHSSPASHKRVVPLSSLPIAAWTGGLPMSGGTLTIDLSDDLDRIADWRTASGTIDLDCDGCVLGDDHAPLILQTGFGGGPIPFGHLAIDTASAHVEIKAGDATLTAHLRGDLDLDLVARVRLARAAGASTVDGCLAYRGSDRLRARDEKLYDLTELTGAPLGADGRRYVSIRGTLDAMRRIPSVCNVPAP